MAEEKSTQKIIHYLPEVVAIEFDSTQFLSVQECLNWLQSSEWSSVREKKGFRIRHKRKLTWLTNLPRAGWGYSVFTSFKTLAIFRPSPYIVVIVGSGDKFSPSNLPPLSTSDMEKKELEEEKKRQRDVRRQEQLKIAQDQRRQLRDEIEQFAASLPPMPKEELKERKEIYRRALLNQRKNEKKESVKIKIEETEEISLSQKSKKRKNPDEEKPKTKKELLKKAMEIPGNQEQYEAENSKNCS